MNTLIDSELVLYKYRYRTDLLQERDCLYDFLPTPITGRNHVPTFNPPTISSLYPSLYPPYIPSPIRLASVARNGQKSSSKTKLFQRSMIKFLESHTNHLVCPINSEGNKNLIIPKKISKTRKLSQPKDCNIQY